MSATAGDVAGQAGPSWGEEPGWGPLGEVAAAARDIRYPAGIEPVPFPIEGPAFFPGGSGLIASRADGGLGIGSRLPVGGVMVLAHNYGTRADHRRYARRHGESVSIMTWRGLLRLLRETAIELEECFFTNAFVGLLDAASNVGSPLGHRDPAFRDDCRSLLGRQVALQRPRLILSLGRFVPNFLASLSPDLAGWRDTTTFRAIDAAGPVRAARIAGQATVVVALVHPCHRHITAAYRTYDGRVGHAAELAMVGHGRACAGRLGE